MPGLRVYRSALRNLLTLAAGLLLLVAAYDVAVSHTITSAPETDEETGALTSRGRSQERTDLMWGTIFTVLGGSAVLFSLASAAFRRPIVEFTPETLRLRVAGPRKFLDIGWDDIAWVHSGADGDDETVPPRVLLVHVTSADSYPQSPWGAVWDGNTLMVEADSWNLPPEDVAAHAVVALDSWRRRERIGMSGEETG